MAGTSNVPGARQYSISWIDSNDTLWLFGGWDKNANYLNDLWKFDGMHWTWVSGTDLTNQLGIYGTKGVADSSNVPGARNYGISWIDSNNTLWLFGGYGYSNETGPNCLNDLWKCECCH
ncbi:MAG: Kelch repeat-containing protein [Promethearchaeota archaeon]